MNKKERAKALSIHNLKKSRSDKMKNFLKFLIEFAIIFILIVVIFPSIYKFSMNGEGIFVVTRFISSFFLLFIAAFLGSLAFE